MHLLERDRNAFGLRLLFFFFPFERVNRIHDKSKGSDITSQLRVLLLSVVYLGSDKNKK